MRVDLHVKMLSERVVRRAKARGMAAVVYAPHFRRVPEARKRAKRFSDDELTVIPGREVFTGSWRERKHLLTIGLTDPIPDFITLEGAMAELQRQDAAVLVPHPTFLTVSLDRAELRRYQDRVHAVETYNPKHWPHHNRRARRLHDDLALPAFASSYAHLQGTVGEAWTTFPDAKSTESGIVEAIKAGATGGVDHRRGLGHWARRGLEFSHLGVENTWQKFERVVLSGTEDTHPRHPAYEGRFDDVAVY